METVLLGVCAFALLVAAAAVLRLRRLLGKSRRAALTFAAPAVLPLAAGAWIALHGGGLALAPLVTIAALCAAAAFLFAPTAGTRFAEFERDFWAHVELTTQRQPRADG